MEITTTLCVSPSGAPSGHSTCGCNVQGARQKSQPLSCL